MSCSCSHNTGGKSGFLMTGGKRRSRKMRRKTLKRSKKKYLRKKHARKYSRRRKVKKIQNGGVSILGDIATNAVQFSNTTTASNIVNNASYVQHADKPYSIGNPYMV